MKKTLLLLFFFISFLERSLSQVSLTLAGYPISSYTSGWVIGGTASTVDSEIELTTNSTSEIGYAYYNTSLNVTACGQFTVDFDYKIQNTSGCLGDGIAFYFINPMTSFAGGGGLGMPNPLTGFVFTMDTYDNDGDGLNPEDELFGYSTATTYMESGYSYLLAPILAHQTYMADGNWHHIHITYNGGTVRVYVNGSPTPTMTGTFPITTSGYFGFSAGTGACVAAQYVKNVYVTSNTISAILGVTTICQGSTSALADSTTGGTWSSSNSGVASVGSATGVVSGVTTGTAVISYSYNSTCVATTTVNVVTPPTPITGTTNVCMGQTTNLYDATGGGGWSSGNITVATVNPTSGVVSGLSVGSAVITYSTGGACYVLATVNVTPQPTAITGTMSVCTGFATTLSDPIPTGVWNSSSTSIATAGVSSGIITGAGAGVAAITYSIGSCIATTYVTVNQSPAVITGTHNMCTGFTTALSDSTASGSWSSANTSIATVGSSTGVVSGIALFGGITTITYTLPGGCYATARVTVNPLPGPIAGLPSVCVGATDALYSGGGSGAWTSSDTTLATVDATGVVTGVGPGTVTITFTLPTGCSRSFSILVVPQPGPITGDMNVCVGTTTTLYDTTAGGGWSSVDPAIGTIDPGTGIAGGVIADTVTILYTSFATGCFVGTVVTVNSLPSAITGITTMCPGSSTSLFDPGGGSWSITPTTIATVGSGSGIVTGIAHGPATVTYTLPSGCAISAPVSVNPLPGAISGSANLCVGLTSAYTDPLPGGMWVSSDTYVAAIGATSGSLLALNPGVTTLKYTITATGCSTTFTVTVNSTPGIISSPGHACIGASTTLTDAISGGAWTCTPSTVATIGSGSGTLTGTGSGVATITYSLGLGCSVTTTLTVNPLPGTISGSTNVCIGTVTTLSDGGGGTWSTTSADISLGAGSGTVAGVSMGTAVITYTLPTLCSRTVTVNVNPSPLAISGTSSVCIGSTITLTDATGGGTWSSAPPAIASIVSATGVITGGAAGTAVISYTLGTGCAKTMSVTVNPLPGLYSVTGGGSYCSGGAGYHVFLSGSAAGMTYQLFNGGTAVDTPVHGTGGSIDFGVQTAAGIYTVVATNTATGCSRNMSGSAVIVINPLPGPIVGPTALCVGATVTETDVTPGGAWTSSLPSGASVVSTTGDVTGHITGTCTTITYTLPTGCAISATVCVSPSPGPVLGTATLCIGVPDTLTDVVPGGVWSGGSAGTASVGSLSGIVYGSASGTVIITYSLGTGCTVTRSVTVAPPPSPVTGVFHLCSGATTLLADAAPGGAWSSGSTGTATVSSGGLVSGVSGGTSVIAYTTTGCPAFATVTVYTTPAGIGGPSAVCIGSTIPETDATTGGIWSVSGTGVTISSTGVVTGVSTGPSVITYNVGSSGTLPGCTVTKTVTVNSIGAITGATNLCTSATTILSDPAGGGTWSSSGMPGIVSVAATTGVITGTGIGTAVITYSLGSGCNTTITVTVNAGPSPIGGLPDVCVGYTTGLTDTAAGGTWSGGAAGIATIDAAGVVTGLATGTAAVSYSLGTGCTVHTIVTVNPAPAAITGLPEVCAGSTVIMADVSAGGIWAIAPATVATISPSGVISGVSAGTATISYNTGAGGACAATMVITVNAAPSLIAGASSVCADLTTTFTDTIPGGAWSVAPGSVAIVDTTGIVTGVSAGVSSITYTLPGGCMATKPITINASPDPITGMRSICIGSSTTLSDATGGGTWNSSASAAIVTVGTASGIVTGAGLGTATISYSTGGICPALISVTVNSLPGAISGTHNVCQGETDTLSDLPGGGLWSSSNILVATIGSATGAVSGIAPGTAVIDYSLGSGCTVALTVTVHPAPPAITGPSDICVGNTATLGDPASGGVWSSGAAGIATIGASTGMVHGISGGIATISYTGITGCVATYALAVTAVPPILGVSNICAYGATLHVTDSAPGGAWTSSLVSVMPGGIITSYAAGIATVYYTLSDGCYTTATLTVNPLPNPISGNLRICVGLITTLGETTTGGIWGDSGFTGIASVGASTPTVTGISPGVAAISYIMPTGCMQVVPVTVSALPSAISGAGNICAGSATTLGDTVTGGIWSNSGPAGIVSLGSVTGIVTGLSAGTTTITYTVAPLCLVSRVVTVNPVPLAFPVTGGGNYCSGGTGEHIGLGGSLAGISYQLYNGSSVAGSSVSGTGAALDFGTETAAGVYKVIASNTITTCSSLMADSAIITISPLVTPSVNISASPGDTVCAGVSATYLATEVNGGPTPAYQWYVNGATAISGSSSYSYTPANGDVVKVLLISDAICASPDTVNNSVIMNVEPDILPVVTIVANPGITILHGQNDTLTAIVTGGGTTLTYQWAVNGVPVPGATNATYTSNNLANGDSVSCIVNGTGPCTSPGANGVKITVINNVGFANVQMSKYGNVQIYPNPATDEIIVKTNYAASYTITLLNMMGETIKTIHTGKQEETISVSSIPTGVYNVNVTDESGNKYNSKLVIVH